MDEDIAISVKNVYKDFRLPHEKVTSVKSAFTGVLKGKSRLRYEKQHALKDISIEIKKGEFFGIVGRNGSGKSTLLKIIAQIYQPTKGSVQVNGKLVPFIELGVGFNPELTGRENVYLNGAILGFSTEKIDKNYKNIVEFAELEEFMDQKLKNYSSGMQVRLAFACATKAEAEILLVDEVLAVGDTNFQRKCFSYFKELKKLKKTVVFISHDLDSVELFCDRVALIDNAKLTYIGNPIDATMKHRSLMAKQNNSEEVQLDLEGTGEIQITKFQVFQNEKVVTQIPEGEPFDIKITYVAKKEIKNPVFGLCIVNLNDTILAGPNTQEDKLEIGTVKGEGQVVASFKSNPLSSGGYTFMVSCFNEDLSSPYDFISKIGQLEIIGKQRYGAINLRPKWSND